MGSTLYKKRLYFDELINKKSTIQPPNEDEPITTRHAAAARNQNDDDDDEEEEKIRVPVTIKPKHVYRYTAELSTLMPVYALDSPVSSMVFLDEARAVVSVNQQAFAVVGNVNVANTSRVARAHLIDPYALQYVFTFNQVASFDSYPYPYVFNDYHELLYRNSLFMFYVYACGMALVENDLAFLPQMDLNSQFLRLDDCQTVFFADRDVYLVPALVLGSLALLLLLAAVLVYLWRSKVPITLLFLNLLYT